MDRNSKKMEKNNRLRILNILGGARDGGAEKFFERICFALSKKHNVSQKL